MCRTTSVMLVGCFLSVWIPSSRSLAADEASTVTTSDYSEQERLALRQLAAILAADSEAWQVVPDSNVAQEPADRSLYPPIPRMSCNIDRVAKFVACYASATASEAEAERRFTELDAELATVLPLENWNGMETAPRLDAVRSYTWQDHNSDAKIDIDIISQESPEQETSYIVTIFGWGPLAPQL